jgi:protease-4
MTEEKTSDGWGAPPPSPRREPAAGEGRDVLERLAFAALEEQRRTRRWNIFFRLFYGALILLFILLSVDWRAPKLASRYSALVELDGVIAADSLANADNVVAGLRAAFEDKGTVGVILRANSPGGSPVQAAYIYDEIKRLRNKYPDKPIYAVIGDVCASGCYYAVAAADKIYAARASLVGSIGVLMDGFGFVETLKKLGIERRLLTAGEHKGFLDPFSPLKPAERRHAQQLLERIHRQFIEAVRAGRGAALKENRELFSGLYWTGEQALEYGLVDELGSASYVAREVIGAEDIVDFTYREPFLERFARQLGTAIAERLGAELVGRAPGLR